MAFLSGLLGALGGPGNIIKSVGSFVSDSLSNLSKGEGLSGIAKAGSNAIKQLTGQSPGPQTPENSLESNNKKSQERINKNNPALSDYYEQNEHLPEGISEKDLLDLKKHGYDIVNINNQFSGPEIREMLNKEKLDKQISNMRPVFQTNTQASKQHQMLDTNAADKRPVFSTNRNQPSARITDRAVYKEPKSNVKFDELKVNSGGFPNKTYYVPKHLRNSEMNNVKMKGKNKKQKKKFKKYV